MRELAGRLAEAMSDDAERWRVLRVHASSGSIFREFNQTNGDPTPPFSISFYASEWDWPKLGVGFGGGRMPCEEGPFAGSTFIGDYPSINVTATRPAGKLAADIRRRLLPEAEDAYVVLLAHYRSAAESLRKRQDARRDLRAAGWKVYGQDETATSPPQEMNTSLTINYEGQVAANYLYMTPAQAIAAFRAMEGVSS